MTQPRHLVRPPGFTRTGTRPDRWTGPDGAVVEEPATLSRLRALALPPAWTGVWVSPDPAQAVQATGVDAKGRTQYRYSSAAQELAANRKFEHVVTFAAALPELRGRVAADLARAEPRGGARPPAERSLAAIVRLLDRGLFRVGNERYARDNHTYGLTTLRRTSWSPRARRRPSPSSARSTSRTGSRWPTRRSPRCCGR